MTQTINEKLGALLLTKKQTRSSLADKIGITRQTFDNRISGASEWKWREVVAIAEITGVSLDELAR